jgi:hypothetical protein
MSSTMPTEIGWVEARNPSSHKKSVNDICLKIRILLLKIRYFYTLNTHFITHKNDHLST